MRVLITGIAGFVGSFLTELLLERGVEVHGLEQPDANERHLAGVRSRVQIHASDIREYESVVRLLHKVRPERIFHLAAQSFVSLSWKSPVDTLSTNVIGQAHLLEAVRELGIRPRIHIAGSSEEYGMARPDETPIREENALRPLSPYAVSKVAQDLMGYQYFKSYRMEIVRTRAFNHTGPRRSEHFVLSNFCKQTSEIEAGRQEPVIRVGNLEAVRDFSDVRDVVRAYDLALDKCDAGEVYNICSGRGWRIRELLDMVLKRSKAKIEVREDPERLRPSDLPIIVGSYEKFNRKTGWKPLIPIEKTVDDLLGWWRSQTHAV